MTVWDGPAPAGTTNTIHSINRWADDRSAGWLNADGTPVVWWESDVPDLLGVQFPPGWCFGAHCRDMNVDCETCADLDCGGCDPEACFHVMPDWVDAKPFWVELGLNHCDTIPQANAAYQRLLTQVDQTGWRQIAAQYAKIIRAASTDKTGASVSTPSEGIGTLLKARGTMGLGWGDLVVPGYAMPVLAQRGLVEIRGVNAYLTGMDVRVFSDPGIPTTGPGDTTPGDGAAYIHIVDRAPTVAFHDVVLPGGAAWNWNDPGSRPLFYDDSCACGGCYQPLVRRRGIVAANPCAVFSIAIDVRDCACPDALPAPGGD